MIRAGRKDLARTLADLAAAEGVAFSTYKKKQLHRRKKHPEPISSPTARVLLYDGAQVDAFRAGEPVPPLPARDDPDDLLDQHEAAALVGLASRSWEVHKHAEGLAKHLVLVRGKDPADTFRGVEHWPRRAIKAWQQARPGTGHNRGGRNVGARDALPRHEIPDAVRALHDAKPDITSAEVHERLGIHQDTASRVLVTVRAGRVHKLLQRRPDLTAEQIAERLGYHLRNAQNALATAHAQQRADTYRPYVASVLDALAAAGISVKDRSGVIVRPGGICAAAAVYGDQADRALVWDERYGWRTDPDPDTSCGRERQPPAGTGIRYLAHGITPDADDVLAQLHDRRTGTKRPRLLRAEAELGTDTSTAGVDRRAATTPRPPGSGPLSSRMPGIEHGGRPKQPSRS